MTCGIYCITHVATGRRYVGQSRNIERRWQDHLYKRTETHISRAISLYGKVAFELRVLEECALEQLDQREVYWIEVLGALHPEGFNLRSGGGHGRVVSDISRERMRQAALRNGSRPPPGCGPPNRLGQRHTPETRAKIGAALRGRKQDPVAVARRVAAIRAAFATQ